MPLQPHVVQDGPTAIHYWTTGPAGAPWLIVCHGGALDHRGFIPLAERLADRYRVLLWDLPGHGQSQPMPRPFTLERSVSALCAVTADAGITEAALLGFSYGGVVAQLYARRFPERERGLLHYACLLPLIMRLPIPGSVISLMVWASAGLRSWSANKATFARLCCLRPQHRPSIEQAMDALGRANYLEMCKSMYRVPPPDPGFRLRGPVMFLHGDADPARRHYPGMFAALRRHYPAVQIDSIPDAGHCAHLDNPTAFLESVERFLAQAFSSAARSGTSTALASDAAAP